MTECYDIAFVFELGHLAMQMIDEAITTSILSPDGHVWGGGCLVLPVSQLNGVTRLQSPVVFTAN